MADNISVFILSSINQIAAHYDIMPWEFVATVNNNEKLDTVVRFESPASGTPAKASQFDAFLSAIGVQDGSCELAGPDDVICRTLKNALERLSSRSRHR